MLRKLVFGAATLLAGCVSVTVVETDRPSSDRDPAVASARTGGGASPLPAHQRESSWYTQASTSVRQRGAGGGARNVILFLGDGMGVSTVTAARILAGQRAGDPGEEHLLSFERFPYTGLSKTYNVDSQTADSAGTMSAIMTGVKTNIGVFGIDENVTYGDCESGRGHELVSLLEIA